MGEFLEPEGDSAPNSGRSADDAAAVATGLARGISRRLALAAPLAAAPAVAMSSSREDASASAEAALRAFLHAFENDDLATMEAAFAPDANGFNPAVASARGGPLRDIDSYRRKPGMPST